MRLRKIGISLTAILFMIGCKQNHQGSEQPEKTPAEAIYQPDEYLLDDFFRNKRQELQDTFFYAGVIYLGDYCEPGDTLRETLEKKGSAVPQFAKKLADSQYIDLGGTCTYLLIMRDEEMKVRIETFEKTVVYESDRGMPVIIRCGKEIDLDYTQVTITASDGGSTTYYPFYDGLNLILPNDGRVAQLEGIPVTPLLEVRLEPYNEESQGLVTLDESGSQVMVVIPVQACTLTVAKGSLNWEGGEVTGWNSTGDMDERSLQAGEEVKYRLNLFPDMKEFLLTAVTETDTLHWIVYNPVYPAAVDPVFELATDLSDYNALVSITGQYDENERQFIELTEKYYYNRYGIVPSGSELIWNEDGTALIHLYEDHPDHRATLAWYTVNPATGKLYDEMTEEEGDLPDQ